MLQRFESLAITCKLIREGATLVVVVLAYIGNCYEVIRVFAYLVKILAELGLLDKTPGWHSIFIIFDIIFILYHNLNILNVL